MARRKTEQPHKEPVEREPWTPWGKAAKRRRERKERKRLERIERKNERIRRRQLARLRRRRFMARGGVFIFLFGIGLIVAFVVLTVLGRPYPWESVRDLSRLQSIQLALSDSESRWESLAVGSYQITMMYTRNDSVSCGPAVIEVEDGEVVRTPEQDDEDWSRACDQLINDLTVDAAFDLLDEQIQTFEPSATILDARFDQDFGYLTMLTVDRYDERDEGCCWTASWSDMQPQYAD